MAVKLENGHNEVRQMWNLPNVKQGDNFNKKDSPKKEKIEVKSPLAESISILKKMPDIRNNKVELGEKLIANPNYPNEEVLDKIADALLGERIELNNE